MTKLTVVTTLPWELFVKPTRTDQVTAQPIPEIVEDPVTMWLRHLGMDIVTGISKLGNFFGQQLDSLCRVAEYDRLVNLQLRK